MRSPSLGRFFRPYFIQSRIRLIQLRQDHINEHRLFRIRQFFNLLCNFFSFRCHPFHLL